MYRFTSKLPWDIDFPGNATTPNGRYITVTSLWAWWRPKSPASWWFAQPFVEAQIKENSKAPRHGPLRREFTGGRWIPLAHKGPLTRKMFPIYDVIMNAAKMLTPPKWVIISLLSMDGIYISLITLIALTLLQETWYIFRYLSCACSWNRFPWKAKIMLAGIVKTIAADALATQVARALATMMST